VFCRSPPAKKGRREEAAPDPLVSWIFLRRRMNPRAASDVGAWSKRIAIVPAVPEVFPALF